MLSADTEKLIEVFFNEKLPYSVLRKADAENSVPEICLKDFPSADLLGFYLDLPHGDISGLGKICSAIGGRDLGIATGIMASLLGAMPVLKYAVPEQRGAFISRYRGKKFTGALAATEPSGGSSLSGLGTVAAPAVRDGTEGYEISGHKLWITNAGVADFYTVLADTPAGPAWFVVDKSIAGVSCGAAADKHGLRLSVTAALHLDKVFVPAACLIGGKAGLGLSQAVSVFDEARLLSAFAAAGAGRVAWRTSLRFSLGRKSGGGFLSEKEAYARRFIADPHIMLTAAEKAAVSAASKSSSAVFSLLSSAVKYFAAAAADGAADLALQAAGASGYSRSLPLEKIKRDVRAARIYEGTDEILLLSVFKCAWRDYLRNGGRLSFLNISVTEKRSAASEAACAFCFEFLGAVYGKARESKLHRSQAFCLELGRLTAYAVAVFLSSDDSQESSVFSRETAYWVFTGGTKLLAEYGASLPSSVFSVPCGLLGGIAAAKDGIAAKLIETEKGI